LSRDGIVESIEAVIEQAKKQGTNPFPMLITTGDNVLVTAEEIRAIHDFATLFRSQAVIAIAEIGAIVADPLPEIARRNLREYFRLNEQIHRAILAAAENPVLTAMYNSLAGRVRRVRFMANMSPERWDEAVREHERILDALARRDGAALAVILRSHLEHKCAVVLESDCIDAEEPLLATETAGG